MSYLLNFDSNGERPMEDLLVNTILAVVTFVTNSVVLILYYSTLISYTSKLTIHKDACKITLPGTILGAVFIFLDPFLPRFIPIGPLHQPIDLGISLSIVIWVVLTQRYCETSWLSAILITFVAVIIYVFILFSISSLLTLAMRTYPPFLEHQT